MNKKLLMLIAIMSTISFGQNASALTFHATASVEIVKNPGGIKPAVAGGFAVSGSDNNVQISDLDKNAQNGNTKLIYTKLKNNEKYSASNHFTAQYE